MNPANKETEGKTLWSCKEALEELGAASIVAIKPHPAPQWEPPKVKFPKRLRNISRWRQ